jgi:NAD(P)H-quinone oxidoreductase subunit 5
MPAEERSHVVTLFQWIPVGALQIDFALLADPLSITMALFVTGIGSLIHLYAIGYMHGDPKFAKFFLYLNLFVFSMLMLVLGENLLVTFLGWEGVGACSYFLISFWHTRNSAAVAGKKAFVTNRIGDWGVMTAMFVAFSAVGSVSYKAINEAALEGTISQTAISAIVVLLFVGACGKSAQLPLYFWLPDAMEGPTPVSALIHAATMVTAGVFLMTRVGPVLTSSYGWVPDTIAIVGAATALFAASIAVAQHDIKRVLAYSTVSQLGFMFLAIGSGAYVAAIFHMITHAFFKALLFLGSGSVIHGMHHEQDMRKMGALRVAMPVTAFTFIIGWLAIAGVPPFAGFWSKDEILGSTFAVSPLLWAVGWVTAGITAFYMFRMYLSTFEGTFRGNDDGIRRDLKRAQLQRMGMSLGPGAMNPQELTLDAVHDDHDDHGHSHAHEPHESPLSMIFPLMALAVPSVLIGLVGTPFANYFEAFIHPPGEVEAVLETAEAFDWSEFALMAGSSVAIATAGIILSFLMYSTKVIDAGAIAQTIKPLYNLSLNKWYIDDIYEVVFVQGSRKLAKQVLDIDIRIVDGLVNLAGLVTLVTGEGLKYLENGRAQFYALIVFGAVLGLVLLSGVT